jgi:hypothetical protein
VIPTSPSERIEDFLAFLTACGEKGEEAVAQGCGASRKELVALMSLCRFPLPTFYVDYLLRFGQGELDLFGDAYTDIATLVRYYRHWEKEEYESLPDNAVVFGCDSVIGHFMFVYPDDDSPLEPVVAKGDPDDTRVIVKTYAESFTRYVYNRAFLHFQWPDESGAYVNLLGWQQNSTPAVLAAALRRGFTAYWFSDTYTCCLQRGELVVHTQQSIRGTEVYLIGSDSHERDEVAAALSLEVGLKILH